MGFLNWVRKRNKKREEWLAFRKAYLQERLDEWSGECILKGWPPESWQYAMSSNDVFDLTGERLEEGQFIRWPCRSGTMRIRVAMLADKKPLHERPNDPTPP